MNEEGAWRAYNTQNRDVFKVNVKRADKEVGRVQYFSASKIDKVTRMLPIIFCKKD
ncbi:hypothetical protein EMIT091MI3_170079 [Kosakonia quasisacchari]